MDIKIRGDSFMNMDFEKMYYLLKNEIVGKKALLQHNLLDSEFNVAYYCACNDLILFMNSLER